MGINLKPNQKTYIAIGKTVFYAVSIFLASHWSWPYIERYMNNRREAQNKVIQENIKKSQGEIIIYIDQKFEAVNKRFDKTNSLVIKSIENSNMTKKDMIEAINELYRNQDQIQQLQKSSYCSDSLSLNQRKFEIYGRKVTKRN